MTKVGEGNISCDRLFHIVFGNDLNALADGLADAFFSPDSTPFENRLVVVPNISRKEFLFRRFASHSRLKMAAGIQVLPLNQAVMEILDRSSLQKKRKRIPTFLELSLAIEEMLHRLIVEKKEFQPLLEYVGGKKQQRISSLSDELARVFARYGLYGVHFLPQWVSGDGWQQILWNALFSESSSWTYPLKALSEMDVDHFQGKIALFDFSYLSSAHLSFFSRIGAFLYQLSPCCMFWEDLTSDKQRLSISHGLKKKGVKEGIREELDLYMQKGHPLLGNWGRLGREMLKSLDPFVFTEEERYREVEGDRLLDSIKRSLLTLDEPLLFPKDDSIQLHSATSKLREVEILRDVLETLLHSHHECGDPIAPSDIVIASPDIFIYAPYIQMVFSQSAFSFTIEGMPLSSLSDSAQGFLQLLSLFRERFALDGVAKLLRCPSFGRKKGFTIDDINQLLRWLKNGEIHREFSSWEEGIDRLLFGLAINPQNARDLDVWPLACIPHSEIDLFNRFLELFFELRDDLTALKEERSAAAWLRLFLQMAEKYFVIVWEGEPFFQELKSLALSCEALTDEIWTFESIQRVLHHLAQKLTGEISSPQMQKITFTSLSLGNIGAARIIGCLGMDEGAFPRANTRNSLCQMTDYIPQKTEEDRALFLELFVKAQDYLIFSYQRIHAEDGKHQEPSLLIEELNQYLGKRGCEGGIQRADHPAFPFDHSYFVADAKVKKWAPIDYLAAKAASLPSVEKSSFFSEIPKKFPEQQDIVIDIRQLKKLARHPLQFYFNETLKIYLQEEEDEEEGEFLISRLQRAILRKEALSQSLSEVMRRIKTQGKLPKGLFEEMATQDLEKEVSELLQTLEDFQIDPEEIFTLNLFPSCQEKEKQKRGMPPLAISLSGSRVAYITGKLEDVTPKGLLFAGDHDLKDLVKAWPLYLIYCCLFPESRSLLLTKKGVKLEIPVINPQESLGAYVEYFLLAKETPSPLMPDFVKAFSKGSIEDLNAAVLKGLSYEDPYVNYLKRRSAMSSFSFPFWSAQFKSIFGQLFGASLKSHGNPSENLNLCPILPCKSFL